jgi:hypothetical protein
LYLFLARFSPSTFRDFYLVHSIFLVGFFLQNLNDMFGAKVVDVGQETPGVSAASLSMIMSPVIVLLSIVTAYFSSKF